MDKLVAEAAERHAHQQADADVFERQQRQARVMQVFGACRIEIVNEPALWPGDHIGAMMALAMMQAAYQGMLQASRSKIVVPT